MSTGISDEEVESDEDDNHFLGHRFDLANMQPTGITQDDDKPCVGPSPTTPSPNQEYPCNPQEVGAKMVKDAEKAASRKSGIDYKSIWINNSLPCIVAQITSGKLLKGNAFFMKSVIIRLNEM